MNKDYLPVDLGGFLQFEWEEIMECLDVSSHIKARHIKYKLQCRINNAKIDGKWK